MATPGEIVAIGEAMIELSRRSDGAWAMGYAGDTLNTAVHLVRAGERVAYLTALGSDPHSARMRAAWDEEGIDTALVLTMPDRLPGLYAIDTDADGERSFLYWREASAARALFAADDIDAAIERARDAAMLFLSGITLAIMDEVGRDRLTALAAQVRGRGGDVAFDPNYRARLWPSADAAGAAFGAIAPYVTIALPTEGDDPVDWPHAREIAIKRGRDGARIVAQGIDAEMPAHLVAKPVDSSGAGDAFNAGYLAARRRGSSPIEAAAAGNRLAATVLHHRGAIPPRSEAAA